MARWQASLIGAALLLGVGCAADPQPGRAEPLADVTRQVAAAAGLSVQSVEANGFDLLLVFKPPQAANTREERRLHVYLSGDGTPWQGKAIAADPSPNRPVALSLMQRDAAEAYYLGRPCYHRNPQTETDPSLCNGSLWTFERYGERVVSAMTSALGDLIERSSAPAGQVRVTLVGYSGGGVLAVLIAQRLAAVDEVVTIAAPLDVEAWTQMHDYTPLLGSLNPASLPPRLSPLRELHLQGAADVQVPPATTERYFQIASAAGVERTTRVVVPDADHRCCWTAQWPLPVVNRWLSSRPASPTAP